MHMKSYINILKLKKIIFCAEKILCTNKKVIIKWSMKNLHLVKKQFQINRNEKKNPFIFFYQKWKLDTIVFFKTLKRTLKKKPLL